MADDRLFLVHKPSLLAVMLGKELAGPPLYHPVDEVTLQEFFTKCQYESGYSSGCTDFELWCESSNKYNYGTNLPGGKIKRLVKNT